MASLYESLKPNVPIVFKMLQPMGRFYPDLYSSCSESTPFLQQSWQNSISAVPLLSMSSVYHFSWPCQVSTPYSLSMSCQIPPFLGISCCGRSLLPPPPPLVMRGREGLSHTWKYISPPPPWERQRKALAHGWENLSFFLSPFSSLQEGGTYWSIKPHTDSTFGFINAFLDFLGHCINAWLDWSSLDDVHHLPPLVEWMGHWDPCHVYQWSTDGVG